MKFPCDKIKEVIERAKAIDPLVCILKPFKERQVPVAIEIALHKKESEALLTEERNKTVPGRLLSSALPEELSTLTPGSDIEIVCQPGNHLMYQEVFTTSSSSRKS